ncbi:MAG TPA: SPFH domain-containing protein [Candidatus Paceibacterota bacterium]
MNQCKSEHVAVNTARYKRWVTGILMPGALLALTMLVQGITPWWQVPLWEYALLFLLGSYYVTSLQRVETGMIAGITLLEEPVLEVTAGWYFVPRFLMEIDWMPAHTLQDQFPGNPEQISKRDDNLGLLPNEFRPIRAMTAPGKPEDGDDPLNTRLALEVIFAVRWKVKPGGFFDVYVKIPGRRWEDKVVNIRQHMRDTGETELIEEISERSPFRVNADMHLLNDQLKEELQTAVGDWGIEIEEARMQAPDFPHSVNTSLADISTALAQRKVTETKAHAEKQRQILVSEGESAAIINLAEARKRESIARGEGRKEEAELTGISGEQLYAGEIAIKTVGEGDLILGEPGIAQALGIGGFVLKRAKDAAP